MRILVIDGAGFIDSHLVDRLADEGYSVRVVDNLSSARLDRLENLEKHIGVDTIELIVGDLKDPQVA